MEKFREISIDGCPEIGRGAHGIVYQIAPDMLVKVYYENTSLDSIRKERELARWAFVKGIPTAIPFHIVRVGDRYGIVFEHLEAKSSADYIRDQANLGMLSSAILSAFAEVIGDASFERVMGLSKSYFTYFGHFLAQYGGPQWFSQYDTKPRNRGFQRTNPLQ